MKQAGKIPLPVLQASYDAFDGVHAYWHLVSDKEDPSWYDKDLGKHWLINETYLKQWPANMWVQIPLVALDQAMKKRDFTIHDIAKFRVTPNLPFICGDYSKSTRTILDARMKNFMAKLGRLLDCWADIETQFITLFTIVMGATIFACATSLHSFEDKK